MVPHNSEFTRKLRSAVRAKIEEFGIDVDDELPDYVMIMVGNKKDKMRMKADLKLFLGEKTSDFVEWLFGFFQKVKSATGNSSATTQQQQQQQKQSSFEGSTEKEKKRTTDNGDEGGNQAEKVPSMEEKPIKHDRRGRTKDSEKSSDRVKAISSSSVDAQSREGKRRPSNSKKRQPSPSAHRNAFPLTKSRSPSQSCSPPRNDRGAAAKLTPPRRKRPSPVPTTHGQRSISPVNRKPVVVPSKGPPALRSVVSVPVQFPPTIHPRVRAVARSPSPPPSSPSPLLSSPPRPLAFAPKVILSGGIVPVETTQPTSKVANAVKIVNQLDIGVAAVKNARRKLREEEKQPTTEQTEEVAPKKQQIIRTALSPPPQKSEQPKQATEAPATKVSRRRVIFGGGSLIFQRAIQQQQTTTTSSGTTSLQKILPKATVIVRPQVRMVALSSPAVPETEEEGDEEAVAATEITSPVKRPTQRRALAVAAQQQTGVSLFQRAIKETKRQRTEEDETEGMGKRPKRISADEEIERLESTNIELTMSGTKDANVGERKRQRIEREKQKAEEEEEKKEEEQNEQIEHEEKAAMEDKEKEEKQQKREKEEEEEEEVLTIDMSRKTGRKREIKKPPKFGLDMVKEHIGGGGQMPKDSRTKDEERKKGQEQMEGKQQQIHLMPLTDQRKEETTTENGQKVAEKEGDHAERDDREEKHERTTVHFKRNWTSHAFALTTSAPIWDGRIEIDDMSSTDDEAEIDAVLEDVQRLRKIALERELPSTASMSRPLLYNPSDFSLSTEAGLISPSDAALLPAVNYKQLVMLSSAGGGGGGGSFTPEQQQQQQQTNTANGGTSAAASSTTVCVGTAAATFGDSSASSDGAQQPPQQQRPHATVAPTTTIQAAPATMIVQQQYQYHQSQQLRPRSHPYSQGYVPPSGHHIYRYQVNRGSVSKVYTGGNTIKFAVQRQNVAIEDNDALKQRLHLLREQHKQKSQSLQRHLEEQRLLLGELQKMATTIASEQRKELLSRVRQMDVPIGQLKRELNEVCEQITTATKCDG